MALSVVSEGASAFNNATTPKTATISWQADDIVVVKAVSEQGGVVVNTPTATGLTFTQRATEGSASGTECNAYIFSAAAAGAGSSVTLSVTRATSPTGHWGFEWKVWRGASGVTGGTGNVNESTTSLTTAAGDAVEFILGDWNATSPFTRALATGSGTSTSEVETTTGQYSVKSGRWENCSAGSAGYGLASYDTPNLQAASAFLVITAAAGGTNYTKTPADSVGATDARTVVRTTARTVADPVGVTDARTVVRTTARTAADSVGVTDAASRVAVVARTVADPVGVSDAVSAVLAVVRTVADPAGITDARALAVGKVLADAVGVSDAAGRAQDLARNQADPVGVTDAAGAQLGQVLGDPVGVTDSVVAARTVARTVADPVGVADAASADITGAGGSPVLLDVFALASADPHVITIPGATAGRDVWLAVNCGAVVSTPSGWSLAASRVADMGSYVFSLPGASNPGGDIGVTLDLTAARALAAAAFEAPPIDTGTNALYGSLIAPTGGGALVGTGAHTFTAREVAVAVFCLDDTTGTAPVFDVSSFDNGFTELGDSGWAESVGSEGARVVLGWAPAAGFTADGVTLTLTGSTTGRSAAGFVAFDVDTSGLFGSKADPVGITDAVSVVATAERTAADTVGVTDEAARTVAAERTVADPVGVTDSVSAVLGQLVADQVGVADAVARVVEAARTVADPVGVTDAVDADLVAGGTSYSRTVADTVEVTDAAARAVGYVRTVADAVGITDTGSPQTLDTIYELADPVGITDAAARAVAAARTVADPVGVTDTAARVAGVVRSRADTVGVTDSVSADATGATVRSPADPVGVTDARTVVRTSARATSDPVGLSDAVTWLMERVVTVSDLIGLIDAATSDTGLAGAPSDLVGITDLTTITRGVASAVGEAVQITGAVTVTQGAERAILDGVLITDAILAVIDTGERADVQACVTRVYLLAGVAAELSASVRAVERCC